MTEEVPTTRPPSSQKPFHHVLRWLAVAAITLSVIALTRSHWWTVKRATVTYDGRSADATVWRCLDGRTLVSVRAPETADYKIMADIGRIDVPSRGGITPLWLIGFAHDSMVPGVPMKSAKIEIDPELRANPDGFEFNSMSKCRVHVRF